MRGRLGFIVLVIFGSFCVYCAQNVTGGNGNGNGGNGGSGMVGNAGADTCCTPPDPPAGVVLFDQKFMITNCESPAIDVGGNRTIVVHGSAPMIQWSFGGAAGWATQSTAVNNSSSVIVLDGRLGKQFRVSYPTSCSGSVCSCPTGEVALTVVGYKQ